MGVIVAICVHASKVISVASRTGVTKIKNYTVTTKRKMGKLAYVEVRVHHIWYILCKMACIIGSLPTYVTH